MAGELFQSERGQISAVEAQAGREKKDQIKNEIQAKKNLFHTEVSAAGKLLSDADAKLTLKDSKEKVTAYKQDISGILGEIVNQGRNALKAENPDADLAVMELLSGSLKSAIGKVKENLPLFHDVEAGLSQARKLEIELVKIRQTIQIKGVASTEVGDLLNNIGELYYQYDDGSSSGVFAWKREMLPADLQAILDKPIGILKAQEAEIAGYQLDRRPDSSLDDDPNDIPEITASKAEIRKLKPAKKQYDELQPKLQVIAQAAEKAQKGDLSQLEYFDDSFQTVFDGLAESSKVFSTIDANKINDPALQTLCRTIQGQIAMQLKEMADLKVSMKARELIKGLSEEEQKYIQVDEQGNIFKTAEFAKLPKEKQMELEAKFKLLEIEVAMELDEKTSGEREKEFIAGRKKLVGGDIFGAKADLLKYWNAEVNTEGHDEGHIDQCREMLKQIAKIELAQMAQRLAAMKEAVNSRYNNSLPGSRNEFGTDTHYQANMFIENMAHVIDAAEELIDSGKVLTIDDASNTLQKAANELINDYKSPTLGIGLNGVDGKQAMIDRIAEVESRDDKTLEKNKTDRLNELNKSIENRAEYLRKIEAGEVSLKSFEGEPLSVDEVAEKIAQRKAELEQLRNTATKIDGMSLDGIRSLEKSDFEVRLKRAQMVEGIKMWGRGFPVNGGRANQVFDMFRQQRRLNVADPEKRKSNTLDEAEKARERGFTGMAKQLYETYFSEELTKASKSVDREAISQSFLKNMENIEKLGTALETWKKSFRQEFGREPSDEESSMVYSKMQSMAVSEVYAKAVKLATHHEMLANGGDAAEIWKKVYGGTVAIEDFGQEGMTTAFWTDEEWNALPVKVGVFTAVTIGSAGIGSGVAMGVGAGTRFVLGRVVGQALVKRVLTTGAGRALAWAGSTAVEGVAMEMARYEMNGILMGYEYERFSGDYWKGVGHSVAMMGVLSGVGSGFNKLRKMAEAGKPVSFIEGGLGNMAKEGGWWFAQNTVEGMVTTGFDAGTAFLSGRDYSAKQALKSFGENYLFAATVRGVHTFMGHGPGLSPMDSTPLKPDESPTKPAKADEVLPVTKNEGPYRGKAESSETPTKNLKAEPTTDKSVGTKKFFIEDINKASGDKPLKPYQPDSPDTSRLIKTGEVLTTKIENSKTTEAQRQNPNSTPEHQQSWGRAYLDNLTGLYNRNGFRLAESWFTNSKKVALASFDGDFFGAFNKLKGTVLGDQVIKQMAKNFHELQQQFRDQGIEAMVIREGGEEFTVIAKDIDTGQMRSIMDNFREKLQTDTQEMIKSLDPNLQIELIQYLQATGKLPQNFPPEHFLTGDRFKLGPIGGSTVGVADVNLSVRKPNDPARVLDSLKRHADHALEEGKNSTEGGRNKSYRAPSYSLKQLETYVADSKLESTRQNPDQPSQSENLQSIYDQGVERRSERFDDLSKTRGWKDVESIVESADIKTQANLNRLLALGQLTAKDVAGMTDKTGQSLAPHTEALLKFQAERLQVMQITDNLTGVQNEAGLAGLLKLRQEQGIPVESYNLDIKLKPINENLGHIGGDAYLMTSAQILTDIIQNLPRDSSDPNSQKFSAKRLSIFRKNPLDGGGFRLIAPEGTLTQQHLDYIMEQYQQRMQIEFFDRIGKDAQGKSVTDEGGLLPEWVKKYSTQADTDLSQLGRINIIKEPQSKLDSIVSAQTEINYRARPEDFRYTQMPIPTPSDLLPTQQPASDNRPTLPQTIIDQPTQPDIPKVAPTQIDLKNIEGKNNTEILRGIETGELIPTKAEIGYLIDNFALKEVSLLLENSKLILDTEHQGRLIDRLISDTNISPSQNPHEVPETAKGLVYKALENGKIDLARPEVAQRLASYETGQAILINLIHVKALGDNPVPYRALAESLLKTEAKRETLEILLDGDGIPADIRTELAETLKQKERAVTDAKSTEFQLTHFPKEFRAELQNLLNTDFANNPDANAQTLLRLGERDPQALEVLKNNNLETLDSSFILAIIEGRKNEFIDSKGQKITAYVGKQVGNEGGVGTAFHTAYTTGESPQLHFAVIKKPHENRKEVFRKETKGAEVAGQFGSRYINKILHAGRDFAIFETGANVRSLREEIINTSPRQALILMGQVMEAMQAYRENGYLHGDLKEVNVIVIDGPNGREVRVIDNDPSPPTARGSWYCTPGYYDGIGLHNSIPNPILAIDASKYSVWDAYALGAMLSTFSDGAAGLLLTRHLRELGPAAKRLVELGKTLKDSDLSSNPDALIKAMAELESIIAMLPPDVPTPTPEQVKITDNAPTVPGQPLPEQLNL